MHRLFVAIRPPFETRERLRALMTGVSGARWQDDAQLHLTLAFIGEVDRPMAEDIAAALASIRATPFAIELEGVSSFGRDGRPNSLWAGARLIEPLDRLRLAVERRLTRAGAPFDHRAFRPHVTVARLSRTAWPIDRWLVDHASLRLPTFTAESFGLYESSLGAGGAIYEEAARYPLG